jgi:hypothetical protein
MAATPEEFFETTPAPPNFHEHIAEIKNFINNQKEGTKIAFVTVSNKEINKSRVNDLLVWRNYSTIRKEHSSISGQLQWWWKRISFCRVFY